MVVGPSSRLDLKQFHFDSTTQDGGLLVSLLRGSLRMITGLIGKTQPDAVRVETQTATIGIRGTDFIVQADASRDGAASPPRPSATALLGRAARGLLHPTPPRASCCCRRRTARPRPWSCAPARRRADAVRALPARDGARPTRRARCVDQADPSAAAGRATRRCSTCAAAGAALHGVLRGRRHGPHRLLAGRDERGAGRGAGAQRRRDRGDRAYRHRRAPSRNDELSRSRA